MTIVRQWPNVIKGQSLRSMATFNADRLPSPDSIRSRCIALGYSDSDVYKIHSHKEVSSARALCDYGESLLEYSPPWIVSTVGPVRQLGSASVRFLCPSSISPRTRE